MTPEENLLAQLLKRQIGTEIEDMPPALVEWTAHFETGKPLSETARNQLWFSPQHRDAFDDARKEHILAKVTMLREQGYFQPEMRMAADSDEDHEELVGQGYKLSMTRSPEGDWFLLLEIETGLLKAVGPSANWSFADDGGQVWLNGAAPDGILEGLWTDQSQSPVERLRAHGVTLTPQ